MYYGKEVIILLKNQSKERFLELSKNKDKESYSLINSLSRMKLKLQSNPQIGDPISRKLFPKSLVLQGIQNLYRLEISNYWRVLYTMSGDKDRIFIFVLYIVNHKEYNKLFGYKNK